jgi:GcrA cell cycle regulator
MEWDETRVTALTILWKQGFSASQVARQLGGVSRSAVIGKIHRMGLAARDVPARPRASGFRASSVVRASAGGVRRAAPPREPRPTPPSSRLPLTVAPTATLLTLTDGACRWPIGNPDEAGFGFCGRARSGAGAYCAGHGASALRPRGKPVGDAFVKQLVSRFVEGAPAENQPRMQLREIA